MLTQWRSPDSCAEALCFYHDMTEELLAVVVGLISQKHLVYALITYFTLYTRLAFLILSDIYSTVTNTICIGTVCHLQASYVHTVQA